MGQNRAAIKTDAEFFLAHFCFVGQAIFRQINADRAILAPYLQGTSW